MKQRKKHRAKEGKIEKESCSVRVEMEVVQKQMLGLMIVVVVVACMVAQGVAAASAEVKVCRERAKKLCGPSKLKFYLHNTVYDAVVNNTGTFNSVARPAPVYPPSAFMFGTMVVFEDPLTTGPSPKSSPLGTAQGSYLFDSMKERTLFHIFTANITSGPYLGSITIMGQVRELSPVRYLSVVGGTGAFLGAHGLATNTLVAFSPVPPVHWTNLYQLDLYY